MIECFNEPYYVLSEDETGELIQRKELTVNDQDQSCRILATDQEFKTVSIYPTQEELLNNERPLLRENKVRGKYKDVVTYLDTQFRLLREDSIRPLRDSIQEYISIHRSRSVVRRLQDAWVYHNVTIESESLGRDGINYSIHFDASRTKRVDWNTTKRLIYGSLVCLSCDGFNSILIGTVSERKSHDLLGGYVEIQFLHPVEADDYASKQFEMVETRAYFEGNRLVLEALQAIWEWNFPFYRYFIECTQDITVLSSESTRYDLSPLKSADKNVPGIHDVPILDLNDWPDITDLDLDESQMEALHSALTKELAIIQGPPGTGKTYVGLKIVQVLLQNEIKWNSPDNGPILVVCYTNHALDQFLEGIDDFLTPPQSSLLRSQHDACLGGKIIRVGGNSKSEKLSKYLLIKQRRYAANDQLLQQAKCNKNKKENSNRSFKVEVTQINNTHTTVMSFNELQPYMTIEQKSDFENSAQDQKNFKNLIRQWLSIEKRNSTSVHELPCHIEHAERILVLNLHKTNTDWQICEQLMKTDVMEPEELSQIESLWNLDNPSRWRLYRYWRMKYAKKLEGLHKFYQRKNFNLGVVECKAKLDALRRGVIHEMYLMDVDDQLRECVNQYTGKYSFMVKWLGLTKVYRLSGGMGRKSLTEQCRENVSLYFVLLIGPTTEECNHTHPISNLLNTHDDVKFDDKAHMLENNVTCRMVDDATPDQNSELPVTMRWHYYRQWRRIFSNLLNQFSRFFCNKSDFQVEHETTKAMIQALSQGIIHERYLTDVTEFWIRKDSRGNGYNEVDEKHSEILHWLDIWEAEENDNVLRSANGKKEDWPFHFRTQKRGTEFTLQTKYQPFREEQLPETNEQTKERQTSPLEDVGIWSLTLSERWNYYYNWRKLYIDDVHKKHRSTKKRYTGACKSLKRINILKKESVLKQAKVIGMTTSGAAGYRQVLKLVRPKIVIVEEAAEVLESHIVTTLSEGCQHLILIGDHKQLRPNPNVYELAKKYNLEISLFERMINNGIPYSCLQKQHRMRPEIAALMKPIYPDLINHEVVYQYPNVRGVSKNVFFINHSELETSETHLASYANDHEARYVVKLSEYFLHQGYDASQITILTLYTAQVLNIKKIVKYGNKVKILTVDNYQGEENDIIILSLVRSNTRNNIGFLKEENRVTVSLSRAKKGLYVIGNFDLLANSRTSVLWNKLVEEAKTNGNFGDSLVLCCQNHPHIVTKAKTADDFRKAPHSICTELCKAKLPCGHVCPRRCHIGDRDHLEYRCQKPCTKTCENNHQCKRQCYEECKCKINVKKILPKCGHEQDVPCWQPVEMTHCKAPCGRLCENNLHPCSQLCYEDCNPCPVKVERTIPSCGHKQDMPCWQAADEANCKAPCKRMCENNLHQCPRLCYKKCNACTVKVKRIIPSCGHEQDVLCCWPVHLTFCKAPCGRLCENNLHPCSQLCYEGCNPCPVKVERTIPSCGHKQDMPCWQAADEANCKAPCERLCKNNLHQCPRLCYKKCKPCKVKVERIIPSCGHTQSMQCCKDPITYKCRKLIEEKHPDCDHMLLTKCWISQNKSKEKNPTEDKTADKSTPICQSIVSVTMPSCKHTVDMKCWMAARISKVEDGEILQECLVCTGTNQRSGGDSTGKSSRTANHSRDHMRSGRDSSSNKSSRTTIHTRDHRRSRRDSTTSKSSRAANYTRDRERSERDSTGESSRTSNHTQDSKRSKRHSSSRDHYSSRRSEGRRGAKRRLEVEEVSEKMSQKSRDFKRRKVHKDNDGSNGRVIPEFDLKEVVGRDLSSMFCN